MRGPRAPSPPRPPRWRLTATWVVVLTLMVVSPTSAQRQRLRRCDRPPGFAVNNVEPMALAEGRVTVVALLTHTCGFCQTQATSLNALHQEFVANGSDVSMFIVNQGSGGYGTYDVSFPVYQDDAQDQIWRQVFGGGKDDIFVFNRCGHLTYRLGMPYAYLGYSYVRRAIHNSLHDHSICPQCQLHASNSHDRMMGDAPVATSLGVHQGRRGRLRGHHRGLVGSEVEVDAGGVSNREHQRNRNRSQCARGDELCKELRRARKKFNRLQRERGMGHLSEEQAVRLFNSMQEQSTDGIPL